MYCNIRFYSVCHHQKPSEKRGHINILLCFQKHAGEFIYVCVSLSVLDYFFLFLSSTHGHTWRFACHRFLTSFHVPYAYLFVQKYCRRRCGAYANRSDCHSIAIFTVDVACLLACRQFRRSLIWLDSVRRYRSRCSYVSRGTFRFASAFVAAPWNITQHENSSCSTLKRAGWIDSAPLVLVWDLFSKHSVRIEHVCKSETSNNFHEEPQAYRHRLT